jgi:sulfatase maturation enzyme AslB (radical SAM superfamily)
VTHPIHDFAAKLRQPSLRAQVVDYVRWRKALSRSRATGLPDPPPPARAPISINLDLTTACNYRCDHCIDWEILNTRNRHDEETLRRSMRTMTERGLRSVMVIGGGEPTLYPGFADFVRFLKQLQLHVSVVSNGSRGEKLLEIADVLGERDWIRLSLDAGSDELFRTMHRPAKRSPTLDEICQWVPRIKARNPGLRVGYSYIIVWRGAGRQGVQLLDNIHEISVATERARSYGFDFIALKPVLERAADGAEIMDPARAREGQRRVAARIRRELDRARALATDSFEVHLSTNLRALEEESWWDYTRQPRTCHMQALRQVVTPTGLFNCPAHRGVEKARIGGADAFANAGMASRTAERLGALMDRFDASRECGEITCLYNGVNWWLEKAVEDPREEVEIEPGDERLDFFL